MYWTVWSTKAYGLGVARPKEFDRTSALERGLAAFWGGGYEATSVDDLTTAMGIGRQSLYDTYGDKRALYLEALDRYVATDGRRFLEPLLDLDATSPLQAIHDSFDNLVGEVAGPHGRRGCMVVNAAIECAPEDRDLSERVRAAAEPVAALLAVAIRRAQVLGEVPTGRDPEGLGRFLADVVQGIRVSSRMGTDPRSARVTADIALSLLA